MLRPYTLHGFSPLTRYPPVYLCADYNNVRKGEHYKVNQGAPLVRRALAGNEPAMSRRMLFASLRLEKKN